MSVRSHPASLLVSALAVALVAPALSVLASVTPVAALSGIINGGGVDVTDQWTIPGGNGAPGSGGSSAGGSWLGPYRPQVPRNLTRAYCVALVVSPIWCRNTQPPSPTPEQLAMPELTLSDLAHVDPESPTLATQPKGWSVVGVETNFIAHIQTHIVTTAVRGVTVDVRFTPMRYDWAFGDGATASTEVPGAEWSVLGVTEFARTPTSHRYSVASNVTPRVEVTYEVDYRWREHDWRHIEGTITRGANAPVIFVQNAGTVLVTGPCVTDGTANARVGCR